MKRSLLCLILVSASAFADEPRVPLNIDPTQLSETNMPLHMRARGAIFVKDGPARAIVVKKLTIKDQTQTDSRTYTVNVDLVEATECGKPFSGPAVVTYCLTNHDRWVVCKIDCTQSTYYQRKK